MGEIASLLALACVGAVYYAETLGYAVSRFERTGGPAVYPKMVLACLFVFIALRICRIVRERKPRPFVFLNLFRGARGKFFLMFAAYILLMPHLGYIVATAGYLTASCALLTRLKEGAPGPPGRFALRALFFLAVTMGLYWFFATLLNVGVPEGVLQYFD